MTAAAKAAVGGSSCGDCLPVQHKPAAPVVARGAQCRDRVWPGTGSSACRGDRSELLGLHVGGLWLQIRLCESRGRV